MTRDRNSIVYLADMSRYRDTCARPVCAPKVTIRPYKKSLKAVTLERVIKWQGIQAGSGRYGGAEILRGRPLLMLNIADVHLPQVTMGESASPISSLSKVGRLRFSVFDATQI